MATVIQTSQTRKLDQPKSNSEKSQMGTFHHLIGLNMMRNSTQ